MKENVMIPSPQLTIRSVRARAVNVPMQRPLRTSGGLVGTSPLVLIDIQTEEGVTGHSYVFFANPILREPLIIEHGYTTPPNASGIGLVWDEDAIRHFLVE